MRIGYDASIYLFGNVILFVLGDYACIAVVWRLVIQNDSIEGNGAKSVPASNLREKVDLSLDDGRRRRIPYC